MFTHFFNPVVQIPGTIILTDGMLIPFRFLKTLRNILQISVVSVADVTWKPLVRGNALMTAVNLNNAVGYLQIHLLADKAVRH